MVDNKDNYLIGDIRWKSVYPRHGFVLVIICIFSLAGYPQDNHYWSQQFGARATLMGGAMIGGVRDNSAIFYNPGAVPFIKYAGLSVNANIYKMDRIFIEDGAGEGVNLNSAKASFECGYWI